MLRVKVIPPKKKHLFAIGQWNLGFHFGNGQNPAVFHNPFLVLESGEWKQGHIYRPFHLNFRDFGRVREQCDMISQALESIRPFISFYSICHDQAAPFDLPAHSRRQSGCVASPKFRSGRIPRNLCARNISNPQWFGLWWSWEIIRIRTNRLPYILMTGKNTQLLQCYTAQNLLVRCPLCWGKNEMGYVMPKADTTNIHHAAPLFETRRPSLDRDLHSQEEKHRRPESWRSEDPSATRLVNTGSIVESSITSQTRFFIDLSSLDFILCSQKRTPSLLVVHRLSQETTFSMLQFAESSSPSHPGWQNRAASPRPDQLIAHLHSRHGLCLMCTHRTSHKKYKQVHKFYIIYQLFPKNTMCCNECH